MTPIRAVDTLLGAVERTFVVILLGGMTLMAFLQVILRNVFDAGIVWAEPFLRHMVLWVGFLGASMATAGEKHINIDMLTRFLPRRTVNALRILTNLFAFGVCGLLARAGAVFLANEMEAGDILVTIGTTDLKAWWFQLIIPAGFGLLALRFLLGAISHVLSVFRPEPGSPASLNVPTIGE